MAIPGGSPMAILFDKLETIIQLLQMQIGLAPSRALITQYPELGELYAAGGTSVERTLRTNRALELLISASLPSAPQHVQTYTVGMAEVQLALNESMPLMRVTVTNLNVAQPLLISKKGVIPSAGGLVLARDTQPYILPMGSSMYGIVNVGNIIVTVGVGYDLQARVTELLDSGRA